MKNGCFKASVVLLVVGGFVILSMPSLLVLPLLWMGYWKAPYSQSPFLEAHQRAVKSFVESEGFGFRRFHKPGLWNEASVVFENERYNPYQVHLIGLTPEKGDRYFESGMPRKEKVASAPYRKLTAEEAAAVAKMRAEKLPWVRVTPPQKEEEASEGIHVIAPVYATTSCLACHQTKEGSLLGAFDYWLLPEGVF